jgi:hypothetical protein
MKFWHSGCSRYSGQVSEYVDGLLSEGEVLRLEQHTSACGKCGSQLSETRRVVFLSKSAPQRTPPRSFALHPAMVREPRPIPVEKAPASSRFGFAARPELALRYGGALASVALLSVLVVDLTSDSQEPVVEGPVTAAMLATGASEEGGEEAAPSTERAAAAAPESAEATAAASDDSASPENEALTATDEAAEEEPAGGESATGLSADEDSAAAGDVAADGGGSSGAAEEAAVVPVVVEDDDRSDAWLAAEIALAGLAAAAFLGSIVWAWRRRAASP